MHRLFASSILVGSLVFAGCTTMQKDAPAAIEKSVESEKAMESPATDVMLGKDTKTDAMMEKEKGEAMSDAAKQIAFTTESEAQALVTEGPVVYFFKASWCPTCQALQKELDTKVSMLPAGTTIVIVDYDKESALKKKYAITYQHTLVQIDPSGNELAKWQGGGVSEITSKIVL